MAREETHVPVDDIDGTPATQSVLFGLDGVAYRIDLSDANALALRQFLIPYVAGGTRIGRFGDRPPKGSKPAGARRRYTRAENQGAREWAKSQGIDVNPRGPVPADVMDAYQAARAAAEADRQDV